MENEKISLVESLLEMGDVEVAAANARLVTDVVQEHRRMRQSRRADPPSDARFAELIGLKEDTYAKARRNVLSGLSPRLSRKSLATIVRSESISDAVRSRAHQLLWLAQLRGSKAASKESALVREALCCPRYFPALAQIIGSEPPRGGVGRGLIARDVQEEGCHAEARS